MQFNWIYLLWEKSSQINMKNPYQEKGKKDFTECHLATLANNYLGAPWIKFVKKGFTKIPIKESIRCIIKPPDCIKKWNDKKSHFQ